MHNYIADDYRSTSYWFCKGELCFHNYAKKCSDNLYSSRQATGTFVIATCNIHCVRKSFSNYRYLPTCAS